MVRLYLEGLASGDFEPIFRALVGETAALSASSIVGLKEEWQHEYETWKQRPLRGRYVYLFADGLYLKAGGERDKTAVLVVLGVDEQGHKELLALEEGYRESTVAWAETLGSLKARGVKEAPLLAIGDGALGLWAALDEVFPTTRHQRCWNHRTLNVLDKLPIHLQPTTPGDVQILRRAQVAWCPGERSHAKTVASHGLSRRRTPERSWKQGVRLTQAAATLGATQHTCGTRQFPVAVVSGATDDSGRAVLRTRRSVRTGDVRTGDATVVSLCSTDEP